ncbi:MAG: hypothetical protein QG656_478 [Candidatus Hydrogenedentes bacterium]|nr:hypothetical protein [Candidatus Hydrogenedentota bacterium]
MCESGQCWYYVIGADDVLISASESWDAFALANGAPDMCFDKVRGRNLFEFVSEPETVLIYRQMIAKVRAGGALVRFRFRCDSPETRRLFEMTMTRQDAADVRFDVLTIETAPHETGALLDRTAPRGNDLLVVCGWCKKVRHENDWIEIDEAVRVIGLLERAVMPSISHGICEACAEILAAS